MPERKTIQAARRDKRQGKSPSTQAGEFVREEIHHIREGKHGARSARQAIAIGLSKARRAGVDLPPPSKGKTSRKTRRGAQAAYEVGQGTRKPRTRSARRKRATVRALKRERRTSASHRALSAQAARASRRRTVTERSAAARKAVRTKGRAGLRAAGRKAARTRMRRAHS